MRKIVLLGLSLLALIFITACDGQLDTLEWVQMPNSVYELKEGLDLEDIKIRINGTEFTLESALNAYPEDVTFTGFDTETPGKKTITVKYKSVSIYWSYEVLGGDVSPIEIESDFTWYNNQDSSFTIETEEQLYGLAAIVNGEYIVDGNKVQDNFEDKVIRLARDMNLSGKIWTPIGAAPKFVNNEVELGSLKPDQQTAALSVQSNLQVGERAFFASYLFVEKTAANEFKYFKSTSITNENKSNIESVFFKGTFDGQGYKIIGLSDIGYTPKVTYEYATSVMLIKGYTFGLFGVVSGGATVKNLVFEDLAIVGAYYDSSDNTLRLADIDGVGAAIGFSTGIGDIVIEKVKVMSGFINAGMSAGGIAGRLENKGELLVKDSENHADITIIDTGYHAGGLVAYAVNVTKVEFINVVNHGDVTLQSKSASKYTAGAFIGSIASGSGHIFSKAVNFGDIKGFSPAGDVAKHKNMINLRTSATQITVSEDCVNFGTALVYQ